MFDRFIDVSSELIMVISLSNDRSDTHKLLLRSLISSLSRRL